MTQPPRYDTQGKVQNANARRIVDLKFDGKPIDEAQEFIVATNNYRASGGGNFPGLDGKNIVVDSPDENRQVVLNYIVANKTINPSADGNWLYRMLSQKSTVLRQPTSGPVHPPVRLVTAPTNASTW